MLGTVFLAAGDCFNNRSELASSFVCRRKLLSGQRHFQEFTRLVEIGRKTADMLGNGGER